MSTTVTELIQSIREYSNQEHSNFVTDDEILRYMNRANVELYDFLLATWEDYVVEDIDIPLISGQDSYTLPANFYKLLGVDMYLDATRKISLSKFNFSERNKYQTATWIPILSANPLRYRLVGDKIKVIPAPVGAVKLTLWYSPVAKTLVKTVVDPLTETDELQSILGVFDDYIRLDCAIQIGQKEETSVTNLVREKENCIARIRQSMGNRDDQNDTVTDVYSTNTTIASGGSWFR